MRGLESQAGTDLVIVVLIVIVPVNSALFVEVHVVGFDAWLGLRRRPVEGELLQGCSSGGGDSCIQAGVTTFVVTIGFEHLLPLILAGQAPLGSRDGSLTLAGTHTCRILDIISTVI